MVGDKEGDRAFKSCINTIGGTLALKSQNAKTVRAPAPDGGFGVYLSVGVGQIANQLPELP